MRSDMKGGGDQHMFGAHTTQGKKAVEIESIDLTNPTPEQVRVFTKIEHQKGVTYSII
jgi:hypothetical protein